MARWTDLAVWRGPSPHKGGAMTEVRGVVEHIAVGFFEGTISWQKNPVSKVSSHFVVARDGRAAQMVDTDVVAWTQGEGNGHWLSVENEGIPRGHELYRPGWELLTDAQIETSAKIFARAHEVYGVPLQVTDHPDGRGLGHHSMGAEHGRRWGHRYCPGEPIKAQQPLIVARAITILGGEPVEDTAKMLQEIADELGFDPGPHDGIPGKNTKKAVKAMLKTALESRGPAGPAGPRGPAGKDGRDGRTPKVVQLSQTGTVTEYEDAAS